MIYIRTAKKDDAPALEALYTELKRMPFSISRSTSF